MRLLPKARTVEIVERDLDAELLIYDLTTHQACTLNETSKIVFKACDGRKTFFELKEKYQFTDELIYFALDQLKKQNLLADESYISPFTGMNRRAVIKQIGLATMIALPVILSLTAPLSSRAASGQSNIAACQPCTQNTDCNSGKCFPVYQGSGSICSNGSQSNFAVRPGEGLINSGDSSVLVSLAVFAVQAVQLLRHRGAAFVILCAELKKFNEQKTL